jgi:phage baseplate assembly protein W
LILGTAVGERVGEPEFGSRLHELIFEPNDDILARRAREETIEALQRWDPYIRIVGVAIETGQNSFSIYIDYVDLRDESPERGRQQAVFTQRRSS